MALTDEQLTQVYKDVFASGDGKIILDDLKESYYDIHPFSPDQTDVNLTVFMEGCRWVVAYILEQVTHKDPAEPQDNHHKGTYL